MERINEELSCLRVLFTLGFAVDVSLLGWLTQHKIEAGWLVPAVALVLVAILTVGVIITARAILQRLSIME